MKNPQNPCSEGTVRCPFCSRTFRPGQIEPDGNPNRTCLVCGHVWRGRGDGNPRRCPSCRSTMWKSGERKFTCIKCGYGWTARGDSRRPHRCPKCQSKGWFGTGTKKTSAEAPNKPVPAEDGSGNVAEALSLYASGKTVLEAAVETGVPLETILKQLRSRTGEAPIRMRRESEK